MLDSLYCTSQQVAGMSILHPPAIMPKQVLGCWQVVEKFTAHYVFALGLSRFISCAHWILQIVDGDSFLLQARLEHNMSSCTFGAQHEQLQSK